jgi:hypothetical protein
MSILSQLIQQHEANRLVDVEARSDRKTIKGDFEGSVTGIWVRFDETGGGAVSYQNKEYLTKIIGSKSIPPGTEVQLTHANGVYYSDF